MFDAINSILYNLKGGWMGGLHNHNECTSPLSGGLVHVDRHALLVEKTFVNSCKRKWLCNPCRKRNLRSHLYALGKNFVWEFKAWLQSCFETGLLQKNDFPHILWLISLRCKPSDTYVFVHSRNNKTINKSSYKTACFDASWPATYKYIYCLIDPYGYISYVLLLFNIFFSDPRSNHSIPDPPNLQPDLWDPGPLKGSCAAFWNVLGVFRKKLFVSVNCKKNVVFVGFPPHARKKLNQIFSWVSDHIKAIKFDQNFCEGLFFLTHSEGAKKYKFIF